MKKFCFIFIYTIKYHFRYDLSGQTLPYVVKYMEEKLGVGRNIQTPSVLYEDLVIPVPFDNQNFINFLRANSLSFSNKSNYRLVRSHGHTGLFSNHVSFFVIAFIVF